MLTIQFIEQEKHRYLDVKITIEQTFFVFLDLLLQIATIIISFDLRWFEIVFIYHALFLQYLQMTTTKGQKSYMSRILT